MQDGHFSEQPIKQPHLEPPPAQPSIGGGFWISHRFLIVACALALAVIVSAGWWWNRSENTRLQELQWQFDEAQRREDEREHRRRQNQLDDEHRQKQDQIMEENIKRDLRNRLWTVPQ